MLTSFEEKISLLKNLFSGCPSLNREAIYAKIMELGKKLPPLADTYKTPENIVPGCQSLMHLRSFYQEGKMHFEAASNALISSGIAYLLTSIYTGESPETVLTRPPQFLEELGIYSSLSLNRSNGLSQLFLKMRKDSLKYLT